MEVEFPKRYFPEGNEPEVDKINNCCRKSNLGLLKKNIPSTYKEARKDPVFGPIMEIGDNKLGYSCRLIHSMLVRQLDTWKLHELYFVFGKRPLHFSLQEFHATTGLKCEEVVDKGFGKWVDEYKKFVAEKKDYVLSPLLVSYGIGERPSHGRTDKVWDVNVDRVYVPYHIHNNHWIALCIDFAAREVLVFDNDNGRRNRELHTFGHIISRIVMAAQSPKDSAYMKISAYKLKYVPMDSNLNRSQCDCGPYALKFIKVDMLGLDKALLDDENMGVARHKMVTDMFIAANDPLFVERMSKNRPPVAYTDVNVVEL